MRNWFNWISNSKLSAAADYTLSGGRLLVSDAREVLALLSKESERLIQKEIGPSNYGSFYPTSRHGRPWSTSTTNNPANPIGIVDHYTTGLNSRSTLLWFSSRPREEGIVTSSAHFVVGRDGVIYNTVPTDVISWHAPGANSTHVGIEHVNTGVLRRKTRSKTGGFAYRENLPYPKERSSIVQEVDGEYWECYTANQLIANIVLKRWLVTAFSNIDQPNCVDHAKVSPGRKRDCGPMWPLENINALVFSFDSIRRIEWHDGQAVTRQDLTDLRHYVQDML